MYEYFTVFSLVSDIMYISSQCCMVHLCTLTCLQRIDPSPILIVVEYTQWSVLSLIQVHCLLFSAFVVLTFALVVLFPSPFLFASFLRSAVINLGQLCLLKLTLTKLYGTRSAFSLWYTNEFLGKKKKSHIFPTAVGIHLLTIF